MRMIGNGPAALGAIALLVGAAATAQAQDAGRTPEGERVLTTVIGSPPADLSGYPEGPELEGFISARQGNKVEITAPDGTATIVAIGEGTQIRASGGFLGLAREELGAAQLLNGVPVKVATVEWGRGLVATEVRLKARDLKTAQMIQSGTSQKFAQQGAAIEQNAAATEALRGRFGDIDKYNVKATTSVFFDTGQFALSASARADLCAAARAADAMDNALLLVVGYTDSTGGYEVNQRLSEQRAGRVVNHLQQDCGWKPWRMLTPTGMAAADPTADNSTPYGRAQNRRVTVNVLVSKSVDGM